MLILTLVQVWETVVSFLMSFLELGREEMIKV